MITLSNISCCSTCLTSADSDSLVLLWRAKLDITCGKIENKQELHGGRYRTCIGQSQQTVKYSSRAPGQGACLKGMSRTITMQGFRFAAISDVEKTKLRHKIFQSQWTVKYRSRAPD